VETPNFEEILKTQVMEERKFLHDVSSPVGTLMFVVEAVCNSLNERGVATPEDQEQLTQLRKQLDRVRDMIVERRKALHERSAVVGLPGAGGASSKKDEVP
jgi:hypothetical protein